jgi:ubiquinone/menaquinone biosynthesis C-methylase UbiE
MLLEAKNPVKKESIIVKHMFLVQGDVFWLPFGSSKFDFVYSTGILGEEVPFMKAGVKEIARVLKSNGIILFTTATALGHLPIIPPYWIYLLIGNLQED